MTPNPDIKGTPLFSLNISETVSERHWHKVTIDH